MVLSSQDLKKEILVPVVLQVSVFYALFVSSFPIVAYVFLIRSFSIADKPAMLPTGGGGEKSDDDSDVQISDSDSD